jgi:hypothetical protein
MGTVADKLMTRTGGTSIKHRIYFLFEQMMLVFRGCNPDFNA